MTIKELVTRLETYPPNTPVGVAFEGFGGTQDVTVTLEYGTVWLEASK